MSLAQLALFGSIENGVVTQPNDEVALGVPNFLQQCGLRIPSIQHIKTAQKLELIIRCRLLPLLPIWLAPASKPDKTHFPCLNGHLSAVTDPAPCAPSPYS